ncbi:MAG: 1-acyl-sn-glycerol-3-phosphate acyltransferase [Nitrosomonadales bacterium]|nr:1-acyl-sn-glycerol-3-phosphate acyltransferase [Nitrosomonadales bacterium]
MLKNCWYRLLSQLLVFLYYHRVRLLNGEMLPRQGPLFFVALHRNGAVDGYVYKSQFPRANFLISVQLRRSLIGRVFFDGIEVARKKDHATGRVTESANSNTAIDACADYLAQGGELLILPEGTSDLGCRHLPFHKGAARTLARLLENIGTAPVVIPLGIHYEQAWVWQSDAEVVAGNPVDTRLPAGTSDAERVRVLHERITAALEELAVQAEDAEAFARRERIAYAATLGSRRSYFAALKTLERGLPEAEALAAKLETEVLGTPAGRRLWLHQGVPLMPMRHAWAYPLLFLLLLPFTALACALNAPPLLIARWAGQRFSDGINTIALWRLLAGFPALLLWAALLLCAALWAHLPWLWPAYLSVSIIGIKSLRRVQKLAITLHNWALAPQLRQPLLNWRASLEDCMRSRNA